MSTSNANDTAGSKRTAGNLPGTALACEAHDLKRILTHLADQIADADRRHSHALSQMQERLGLLGSAAHGLREHLPKEMTGVLDRIEGGMAELSERIAEADAQRRGPQTNHPVAETAPSKAAAATGQPAAPALRSALAADALDAYARRAQSVRTGGKEPVDHFDVVETAEAVRDEDFWDRDAADALARLYESSVSNASGAPALDAVTAAAVAHAAAPSLPDPGPTPAAPPAIAKAPTPVVEMPPAAPILPHATKSEIAAEVVAQQAMQKVKARDDEREWLEARFGDIAKRLETSLSGIKSGASMEAIEARFSTLERKFSDAIGDTAKITDLASLKSIETHVEDLNAQLVSVQTHFSRLDTIELELRSLAERMSAEELGKLLDQKAYKGPDSEAFAGVVASRVVQQMPRVDETLKSIAAQLSAEKIASIVAGASQPAAGPDADAIARIVAEQVSRSLPKAPPPVPQIDPTAQIKDLKSTLEILVAEQRHGGEQTTTMLDTMQQAMIRMLDRMDAIEQSRYADADDLAEDRGAHSDTYGQPHSAGPDYASEPAPRRHEERPAPQPVAPTQAHPVKPELPAGARIAMPVSVQPVADYVPEHEARGAATAPPSGAALRASVRNPMADEADLAASPANRDDFIASARRAARMAAEAQPEPEEVAETVAPKAGKVRAKGEETSGGRQLSKVSMALLCFLLVGASFVAVKSTILAPPSTASSNAGPQQMAQPTRPAATESPKAAVDKRLQNLEDADVLLEDDRNRRAPDGNSATPRRSSLQQGGEGQDLMGQLGFPAGVGGFNTQRPGAQTVPAALTKDAPAGSIVPRTNDLPPLSIGPNSLRTAAAKGDASAEFEIGARFAEGKGVPQDLQQAVNWYQRSAAQGFAPAQYRLGSMFERGLGVKVDLGKARVWYQRAAEQGIVKAMHNLAVLTAGRDSEVTDYAAAGKWFRSAADHGLADSQFNLAIMYDSGLGMERSSKQAFKWFSLAARAGDEEASRRREALRQKMQPQEAAEVEAEITNWRPKSADPSINDPRIAGEAWKKSAR